MANVIIATDWRGGGFDVVFSGGWGTSTSTGIGQ